MVDRFNEFEVIRIITLLLIAILRLSGPALAATIASGVNCGTYTCDLTAVCSSPASYHHSDGPGICANLGNNWFFASVPTLAAATSLKSVSTATMWVGGDDKDVEDSFIWRHGRNGMKVFSIGDDAQPGFWTRWKAGNPDNWSGDGPGGEDCVTLDDNFNDANCGSVTQSCIACERALCKKELDCEVANTVATFTAFPASTYWPDCSCLCKKFYSGRRCRPNTATALLTVTKSLRETLTLRVVTASQRPTSSATIRMSPTHSRSTSKTRSLSTSSSSTVKGSSTLSPHMSSTISASYSKTGTHGTVSLSPTNSISTSRTFTNSRSETQSRSSSRSLVLTSSTSLLASLSKSSLATSTVPETKSETSSQTISITNEQIVTATDSSSATMTGTRSNTTSITESVKVFDTTTKSWKATPSSSLSSSLTDALTQTAAITGSCADIPPELANTTCSLLWPTTGNSAHAGGGNGCERIELSYSYWGGKSGSTFVVNFAANGTFVTVQDTIYPAPTVSGPFAVATVFPNQANSTITLLLTYTGSDTMNAVGSVSLAFAPSTFRCPQPAPLQYTIVPIAAPKSSVATATQTIQQIAGTLSLVMAMPAVAAQMGMLSGLQDLTRCEKADLSQDLDFMNNPLGLALGDNWGASQRGVFAGTIVILLAFTLCLCALSGAKLMLVRLQGPRPNERWPPTYLQQLQSLGAPGVYLLVAAFLMDSTVTAGVAMTLFGESTGDRVLGVAFALGGYAYVASIFWTTLRTEMTVEQKREVIDEAANSEAPVDEANDMIDEISMAGSRKLQTLGCMGRWFRPSAEYSSNAMFHVRYGTYVADLKQVRCYRGLELTSVCIVSSLQAAAYGTTQVCVIELGVALAALVVLFAVVVFRRPMSVLFEFSCTAVSLGAQIITAILMISNMYLQDPRLEVAALCCIMIGTLVTLVQAIQGMIQLAIESVRRVAESYRDWQRLQAQRKLAAEEEELLRKNKTQPLLLLEIPLLHESESAIELDLQDESSDSDHELIDDDFLSLYTKGSMQGRGTEVEQALVRVETAIIDRSLMGGADGNQQSRRKKKKRRGSGNDEVDDAEELRELVDQATAADALRRASAAEQAKRYRQRRKKQGTGLGITEYSTAHDSYVDSHAENQVERPLEFEDTGSFGPLTAALFANPSRSATRNGSLLLIDESNDEFLLFSSPNNNSNNDHDGPALSLNTSAAFGEEDDEGPATIPTFV